MTYKAQKRLRRLLHIGFEKKERFVASETDYYIHPKIKSEPFIHKKLLERYTAEEFENLLTDSKNRIK